MHKNTFEFNKDSVLIIDSNYFLVTEPRDYIAHELFIGLEKFRQSNQDYFLHIPNTVIEELKKKQSVPGTANIGLRTRATRAIDTVNKLLTSGMAVKFNSDITGVSNGFNDGAMLVIVNDLRRKTNIDLLTNDRAFATDLINLNNSKSVLTNKKVTPYYYNKRFACLSAWQYDKENETAVYFANELKNKEKKNDKSNQV